MNNKNIKKFIEEFRKLDPKAQAEVIFLFEAFSKEQKAARPENQEPREEVL